MNYASLELDEAFHFLFFLLRFWGRFRRCATLVVGLARGVLVSESSAYCFQVLDVFGTLIIVIGPSKSVEMPFLKKKWRLHKNTIADIDALPLVFCSR